MKKANTRRLLAIILALSMVVSLSSYTNVADGKQDPPAVEFGAVLDGVRGGSVRYNPATNCLDFEFTAALRNPNGEFNNIFKIGFIEKNQPAGEQSINVSIKNNDNEYEVSGTLQVNNVTVEQTETETDEWGGSYRILSISFSVSLEEFNHKEFKLYIANGYETAGETLLGDYWDDYFDSTLIFSDAYVADADLNDPFQFAVYAQYYTNGCDHVEGNMAIADFSMLVNRNVTIWRGTSYLDGFASTKATFNFNVDYAVLVVSENNNIFRIDDYGNGYILNASGRDIAMGNKLARYRYQENIASTIINKLSEMQNYQPSSSSTVQISLSASQLKLKPADGSGYSEYNTWYHAILSMAKEGQSVMVTITDSGDITLPTLDANDGTEDYGYKDWAKNILWFCPNAGENDTVTVEDAIFGTILAPRARVHNNANIVGAVICRIFDQGGEVHQENWTERTPDPNTGRLSVKKMVEMPEGEEIDTTVEYAFTVTLDDTSINGPYGDMTFVNGVATFTLRHGNSISASGLPAGIGYTVEETSTGEFIVSATGEEGTIEAGKSAEVLFTNSYKSDEDEGDKPETTTVTVNKVWKDNESEDRPGSVTVQLKCDGENYGDTVTLDETNHWTYTWTDLEKDHTWTVEEVNVPEGYEASTSNVGSVWTITNTKDTDDDEGDEGNEPEFGSLTVSKIVVKGEGAQEPNADDTFTFTITLKDADGNVLTDTYEYTGDVSGSITGTGTVQLKAGQFIVFENLPVGTRYEVTETVPENYTADQAAHEGSIDTDGQEAKVTVTNTYTKEEEDEGNDPEPKSATVDISVEKKWEGDGVNEVIQSVEVRLLADGQDTGKSVTLSEGNWTHTWTGLDKYSDAEQTQEIKYTVEETTVLGENFETTYSEIENGTITITNTYTKPETPEDPTPDPEPETVDVSVSKIWDDGESEDRPESVTVQLYRDGEAYGEVITLSAENNWKYTWTGLEKDHDWTVGEINVPEGYEQSVENENGVWTITNTKDDEGDEPEEPDEPETPEEPEPEVGSLTVSKTVAGNAGDMSREFHFTVTLSDTSINGTYGDMTFVDGVATFALRGGKSKTATDLPAGITYTVTETEADQDGYVTTSTGSAGEIAADGNAAASFTNTRNIDMDPGYGNLTVSKIVGGIDGDRTQEFTFIVTLSDTSINGTYGDMTFNSGVATFTLRHGQSLTAHGLPEGITYSVMEVDAHMDGYFTASSGRDGTIQENGTAQAIFFNTRGDAHPDDPELEEFDDDPVPLAGWPDEPKTGDESKLGMWIAMMTLSMAGFGLVIGLEVMDRKRKHSK